LRFADVRAGGDLRAPLCELLREVRGAAVVEAHAVHDRVVFADALEARAIVSGLAVFRGDGAELDEAAAERGPEVGRGAVFVEAGGEAERVRKFETERLCL